LLFFFVHERKNKLRRRDLQIKTSLGRVRKERIYKEDTLIKTELGERRQKLEVRSNFSSQLSTSYFYLIKITGFA
jgi:hypothetical protein